MKPYRYLLLLPLLSGIPDVLSAQSLSDAQIVRIDELFAEYDRTDGPGFALGIYRNGKLIHSAGYGSADLEHNIPITPGTRFDIGSTSKQFTAAALLLLQEEGKLSLEDDVRKYIPELPDYGRPITIRHLLNHTGGLRDYIGLMAMSGVDIDDVTTDDDALRVIVRQKGLEFEPGTDHLYSNTGYFLASIIVERVSGRTLREYAAERLFKPLGMTNTTYLNDHTEVLPDRAIAYSPGPEGDWRRDVSYWEQNGDGGVFTTVEDLLLWDENFYKPRVGGANLNRELLRRGVLENGDTLDYALGLFHADIGGIPVVSHGGAWGGYRAELMRVPSEHLSVALLSNCGSSNPSAMAEEILSIILADRLPASDEKEEPVAETEASGYVEVGIDPSLFDAYVGDYGLEIQPDFVLTFSRQGDRFYSQATGQGQLEIFPASDSTFFLKDIDASLTFHREDDGSVDRVTLHQGGDFVARRVTTFTVKPEVLKQYEGTYYSEELETICRLEVEDGRLKVIHPRFDPAVLKGSEKDRFTGDQWYLREARFERDAGGRVVEMVVTAGRVRDLRFIRQE